MSSSVSRSVSRPVSRSILAGQSNTLASIIKSLFANNEQGFAYDPNDLTTMFQDAAGTIPVTAVGQPVGLMQDKSGRNNRAFQTNSASRPILRKNAVTGANYLEFYGSDDFLQISNIDFTMTDKVSLFAGVRKLSDANAGCLVGGYVSSGSAGVFEITAPRTASNNYGFTVRGSGVASIYSANGYGAPDSYVLSCSFMMMGVGIQNQIKPRINGLNPNLVVSSESTTLDVTTFNSLPLYIGRRGGTSLPFNGHIYGLIGIGRLATDSETIALEKAIAKNTGVTLNV